jgi:hypothetical protein
MSNLAAESDQPLSTVMSENGWAAFLVGDRWAAPANSLVHATAKLMKRGTVNGMAGARATASRLCVLTRFLR